MAWGTRARDPRGENGHDAPDGGSGCEQDFIMMCLQLVNLVGMMQQAKDEGLAQNVQVRSALRHAGAIAIGRGGGLNGLTGRGVEAGRAG